MAGDEAALPPLGSILPLNRSHRQSLYDRTLRNPAEHERRQDDDRRDGAELGPEQAFLPHESRHIDRHRSRVNIGQIDCEEERVPDEDEDEQGGRDHSHSREWENDAEERFHAVGYVLKDIPPTELIVSLRAVCNGSVIISPSVANKLLKMREGDKSTEVAQGERADVERQETPGKHSFLRYLSRREIEILRLIGKGYDNTLIAKKLSIAEQTVKNHVSVIYSKLNVHNRIQVMKLANTLTDYIETE